MGPQAAVLVVIECVVTTYHSVAHTRSARSVSARKFLKITKEPCSNWVPTASTHRRIRDQSNELVNDEHADRRSMRVPNDGTHALRVHPGVLQS